jgi:hypothetical protein
MRYTKAIIAFFSLLTLLFSCKKNEIEVANEDLGLKIEKSKNFFNEFLKSNEVLSNSFYDKGKIYWSKADYFPKQNVLVFETNLKSKFIKKFLFVKFNTEGEVEKEEYNYILSTKISDVKIEDLKIDNEIISLNSTFQNFSGFILSYNLDHKKINSVQFQKGKVINNNEKYELVENTNSNNTFNRDGNTTTQNFGIVCTQWYWNVYMNGILISSTYVFTTCVGEATDTLEGDNIGELGATQLTVVSVVKTHTIKHYEDYDENWTFTQAIRLGGIRNLDDRDLSDFSSVNHEGYAVMNHYPAAGGPWGPTHTPSSTGHSTTTLSYSHFSNGPYTIAISSNNKTATTTGSGTFTYINLNPQRTDLYSGTRQWYAADL